MGRKIYIDLGAFMGSTIEEFYKTHDDAADYLIYAWEPLIKNYIMLTKAICAAGWDNVICMNYAASNADGIFPFYANKNKIGDGATLIDDKITGGLVYDRPLGVRCINFCEWFKRRVNPNDYVALKMNIEGGEYQIMDDMIDSGVLDYISEFRYWLHSKKIKDGPTKDKYRKTEDRFEKELETRHMVIDRVN